MNVGSHIGQYKIVRKLGAGGMGTVFLGEHMLLGRRAAIKTLLPALSQQREIVDRFFNEARATSAISDPGVVQVFDFGYHVDGTAYIVMELLEGEALSARIDRLGTLPAHEALRIARQCAASLAAAHERGIVHRDLKPENVFLIRDPEAQAGERTKILDFGICKLNTGEATPVVTNSDAIIGTPVFMSPEQCRGGAVRIDHRSDIYALGCVLFNMLTGRTPFECEAPGEFIVAHLKEEPPAPSSLVPGLPAPVDALLAKCLAKSPDDRFQTMAELASAIDEVLAALSSPGVKPSTGPRAMQLAAGFKSAYDANFGSALPTRDALGIPRLRITPPDPTPPPVKRDRPSWRAAFAIVSVGALAAAALVTRLTIGGDEAIADPSHAPFTVKDEPRYGSPAPVPTEAPAGDPAQKLERIERDAQAAAAKLEAELATDDAPVPLKLDDAPARVAAKQAKPTPKKTRVRAVSRQDSKPSTSTTKKPSASTTEDLYETR